jgi:hypothetical protein
VTFCDINRLNIVKISIFFLNSSRSPSHHRPRRSPASASSSRRQPNEAHRENPIPSAVLGVFGLSQYTTERDLKGT